MSCVAGLVRPIWGLAGYLFLVYLQPEWNWRFDGLQQLQYQKYVVLCIAGGFLAQGMRGNTLNGWAALSMSSLVGYVLLVGASSYVSQRPIESSIYFDIVWKTAFVSFLIVKLANTPQACLMLVWAIVLGSGFNALRINEDYFTTGVTRYIYNSWGYKGDSNVYTLFTFPALTSSMVLCFISKKPPIRILAGCIAVLLLHQLMLLESRGGMLGAALSIVVLVYFVKKTAYTNLAILVGAVITVVLAGPPVLKEFTSIFAESDQLDISAQSRFTVWRASLEIAIDNPLLGVGPNATQYVIPKYVPEYSGQEAKHPHNVLLEITSGSGIFAGLLLLVFLFVPVFSIYFKKMHLCENEIGIQQISLISLVFLPGFLLASLFAGGGMIESLYFFGAISICGVVFGTNRELDLVFEENSRLDLSFVDVLNDGSLCRDDSR